MIDVFQKELQITPSCSDFSGNLSYQSAFSVFMDIAFSHAELLGVGLQEMQRRDMFWLTVKTKVRFFRRPKIGDIVTLRTWPEVPEKIRCVRSYEISKEGEVLVAGKTEWAVINTNTHGLVPIQEVFPGDVVFTPYSACEDSFARVPNQFPDPPYSEYTVTSADIDIGGHMNNAAYVRALMSSFTGEELQGREIKEMDVIFRTPCYEKDVLSIQRRQTDNSLMIRFSKGEETVLLARLA